MSSYPISVRVYSAQLGIWVEDTELLWLSKSLYLTHVTVDSFWWPKNAGMWTHEHYNMGKMGFGIITVVPELWAEPWETAGKRRKSHPSSPVRSAGRIGRCCCKPCGFVWAWPPMRGSMSRELEDWWFTGTSFTELEQMCILSFAITSMCWFLLLSQNIEVEGFIDSRRLWFPRFVLVSN